MTKLERGCAGAVLGLLTGFLAPILLEILILVGYGMGIIPPIKNMGIADFGPILRVLTRLPFTMRIGLIGGIWLSLFLGKVKSSNASNNVSPIAKP